MSFISSDLGYTELFCIPEVTSVFISSCDSFLGTLWCSIKRIKPHYMFDWQYGIALHAMQGNRSSYPGKRDVSWDFSSCGRNLRNILELQRGWPFETPLCSAKSALWSSYDGHFRNLNWLGRIIQTLLEMRWETKCPFLVSTEILGFLSNFKNSQASSAFEALNSTSLWRCQGM